MDLATIIGMIGVSGILGAYFANLFSFLRQDSYPYILINLFGAGLACISSVMINSVPFIILEATWTLVSFFALGKKVLALKQKT